MSGNPFKAVGDAVGGILGGAVDILTLGATDFTKQDGAKAPEPPEPVETYNSSTEGTDSAIRRNRRKSSFGSTLVATKGQTLGGLGASSGIMGKTFLGQ